MNSPINYIDPDGYNAMAVAEGFPQGALVAGMLLGAGGGALLAFIAEALVGIVIAIAVITIVLVVGMALYLTYLKVLEFVAEMGRIQSEVDLAVRIKNARERELGRLRKGRYSGGGGGDATDACAAAIALTWAILKTEGPGIRFGAAAAWASVVCASGHFGDPSPPMPRGPTGIPVD